MKKLRYLAEAALLYLLYGLFRLLPLDTASNLGGWIGRTVGPRLAASRKARANLQRALPDLSATEQNKIIAGMWDNLGRVMAEYAHLAYLGRERVEIINPEKLPRDRACIVIGGHLANWEMIGMAPRFQLGVTLDAVYRAPNNPWSARLLDRTRSLGGEIRTIAKSRTSARGFVESLSAGRPVGMLIDQKYNEGIAIPFFGHDAMTSTAFVKIPQKYDCPLIPVRIERMSGAHFRLTFLDPLEIHNNDGTPRAVESVVADAHHMLERWIREKPEQWLWLHRRWPRPGK